MNKNIIYSIIRNTMILKTDRIFCLEKDNLYKIYDVTNLLCSLIKVYVMLDVSILHYVVQANSTDSSDLMQ